MDEIRKIRFLIPIMLFVLSLLLGAYLARDTGSSEARRTRPTNLGDVSVFGESVVVNIDGGSCDSQFVAEGSNQFDSSSVTSNARHRLQSLLRSAIKGENLTGVVVAGGAVVLAGGIVLGSVSRLLLFLSFMIGGIEKKVWRWIVFLTTVVIVGVLGFYWNALWAVLAIAFIPLVPLYVRERWNKHEFPHFDFEIFLPEEFFSFAGRMFEKRKEAESQDYNIGLDYAAAVAFNYDYLYQNNRGVHDYLVRRWSGFIVSVSSYTGLWAALGCGILLGFENAVWTAITIVTSIPLIIEAAHSIETNIEVHFHQATRHTCPRPAGEGTAKPNSTQEGS